MTVRARAALRRAVVCVVLLFPAAAGAVPLSPDAFTLYVRTELARGARVPVTALGPLMLSIHYDDGVDRRLDLGRLHERCFRAAGQCRAIIADYVRDVRHQVARMAHDRGR